MAEEIEVNLDPDLMTKLHTFPIVSLKVQAAATAIGNQARATAPVDSGQYRDGIVIEKSRNYEKTGVWVVHATDEKSSWVEFGTTTEEPHFTMRNAVTAVGLSFRKGKGA